MKRRYKVLIIILAFLIMAFIATGTFLTNQMQWVGLRQTGNHSDEGAVTIIKIKNMKFTSFFIPVNLVFLGMRIRLFVFFFYMFYLL